MNKEETKAYTKVLKRLSWLRLCQLRNDKIHQLELIRQRINKINGVKE